MRRGYDKLLTQGLSTGLGSFGALFNTPGQAMCVPRY